MMRWFTMGFEVNDDQYRPRWSGCYLLMHHLPRTDMHAGYTELMHNLPAS
jgi:hypothetical protein